MPETFTEICKLLLDTAIRMNPAERKPKYSLKELTYLLLWARMEKVAKGEAQDTPGETRDDGYISTGWKKDLANIAGDARLRRMAGELGLARDGYTIGVRLNWTVPALFSGDLSVDGMRAVLETHSTEVSLAVNERRYRYCTLVPISRIKVDLRNLKGFGKLQVVLSGARAKGSDHIKMPPTTHCVRYRRSFEDLVYQFSGTSAEQTTVPMVLYFLGITPARYITMRIDAFMEGKLGSAALLRDFMFLSKSDGRLEVSVDRLVAYLEAGISNCTGDVGCYKLYSYVAFLTQIKKLSPFSVPKDEAELVYVSVRRLQDSIFDPKFNTPILWDSELPESFFTRLSSKILGCLAELKTQKDISVRAYQMLRCYVAMKLKLNRMFICKFFIVHSSSKPLLDMLLEMNLSATSKDSPEGALKKLWDLFCRDLKCALRRKEDVAVLYRLLFANFRVREFGRSSAASLFDQISKTHTKEIRRAKEMEELKAVHSSMISCEKSLGYRNERIEMMLKERVAELIKK